MNFNLADNLSELQCKDFWELEAGDGFVREDIYDLVEEESVKIVESTHKLRVLISLFKSFTFLSSNKLLAHARKTRVNFVLLLRRSQNNTGK